MDISSGIVLGVVQGLTEFLPISSSGHLIIARDFFGFETLNGLAIDAVLQLGTICAVGVYFYKDLLKLSLTFLKVITKKNTEIKEKILLFSIILGTIPGLLFGLALERVMETLFRNMFLVGIALVTGGILFLVAEKYALKNKTLSIKKGIGIGFFQVLALIPGMSRSGMTISGGLILGLTREESTRFSFLLSFPIILGSGLKKLYELNSSQALSNLGFPFYLSSVLSFFIGLIAIHFLLLYLKSHSLRIFAYYRFLIATIIFATLLF